MTEMNVPQVQGVLSGLAAPRAAAARGVQPHEVWAVADALLMEGQRPTIERVRQKLGRGSPNTVAPMLEDWFAQLGQRLQGASVAANGSTAAVSTNAPSSVQDLAQQLWDASLEAARLAAQDELQQAHAQLQQERDALADERAAWAQEQWRLRQQQAASEQLAALAREHAAALQTRLDQAEAALREREQQLSDLRLRLDAAQTQHAQDVSAWADERQQLQERYSRNERHWLQELDNARQDAKQQRANLALSQRERDALAQQLSASQTQAQELKLSLHTTEQQTDHWQARCAQLEAALTQEREQQAAWLAQWAQRLAQQPAEKSGAATTTALQRGRIAVTPSSRMRRLIKR